MSVEHAIRANAVGSGIPKTDIDDFLILHGQEDVPEAIASALDFFCRDDARAIARGDVLRRRVSFVLNVFAELDSAFRAIQRDPGSLDLVLRDLMQLFTQQASTAQLADWARSII